MAVYNTGSWVFVEDAEDAYFAAKVTQAFKAGESTTVERDGYRIKLTGKQTKNLLRMDEQSLKPIDNMVELRELNEASILENLRIRFQKNEIYTSVGAILVAVNPFKLLPLYTAEVIDQYKTMGYRNLGPHVYGVADNAYKSA